MPILEREIDIHPFNLFEIDMVGQETESPDGLIALSTREAAAEAAEDSDSRQVARPNDRALGNGRRPSVLFEPGLRSRLFLCLWLPPRWGGRPIRKS